MKSKVSTEWFTISHPNRRARLSGNDRSKYATVIKLLKTVCFNDMWKQKLLSDTILILKS